MMDDVLDRKYMARALMLARRAEAEGEVPVGAVIVREEKLLARAGIGRLPATTQAPMRRL